MIENLLEFHLFTKYFQRNQQSRELFRYLALMFFLSKSRNSKKKIRFYLTQQSVIKIETEHMHS